MAGGIVPKKKRSQSKKRIRHSTRQTSVIKELVNKTNITKCVQCGANKLSHRICGSCGYYKGKQIITIKSKSDSNITEA